MVSHWWGTPFVITVKMLRLHATSRNRDAAMHTSYWCCTLANNQHNLQDLGGSDLLKTPFAKAMRSQNCLGTVLLCDLHTRASTSLLAFWVRVQVLDCWLADGLPRAVGTHPL